MYIMHRVQKLHLVQILVISTHLDIEDITMIEKLTFPTVMLDIIVRCYADGLVWIH